MLIQFQACSAYLHRVWYNRGIRKTWTYGFDLRTTSTIVLHRLVINYFFLILAKALAEVSGTKICFSQLINLKWTSSSSAVMESTLLGGEFRTFFWLQIAHLNRQFSHNGSLMRENTLLVYQLRKIVSRRWRAMTRTGSP
jgi:hypothetical protein